MPPPTRIEEILVAVAAASVAGAVAFAMFVYLGRRFNRRLEDRLVASVSDSRRSGDVVVRGAGGILGMSAALARRLGKIGPAGLILDALATPSRLKAAAVKIDRAGMRDQIAPRDLVDARIVGGIVGFLLVLVAGGGFHGRNVIYALVVGVVMWRLSMVPITNAIQRRQSRVRGALPKAADIMVVAVEAGLTLDKAMALYCDRFSGPLAEELTRIQEDIRIGFRRGDAFRAAIARVDIEDLSRFLGAILLAERFGVPVAMVLRNQSSELKQLRSQRIRENSMKAPIKMLIPTVMLIMPALFIILMGPLGITLATGGLF
ncbi:MAG: type II secretion system F family protein [Anaerolineae bacterium]